VHARDHGRRAALPGRADRPGHAAAACRRGPLRGLGRRRPHPAHGLHAPDVPDLVVHAGLCRPRAPVLALHGQARAGRRGFRARPRAADRRDLAQLETVTTRRAALLLAPAPVLARAAPPADLASRLKAQADAWDRAIVARDRAAIAANMADDFRQIDARGNVETKASFIDGLVSPDLQLDPYTVEDFEVRVYGDTALLSGRTRMTGRYQGQPFNTHYRYIDVYVKRRGVWKIVSVQISPISD
ncbi:MAG: nuclear transport factor 2 family protein, partial [Rubrivivax sp.]